MNMDKKQMLLIVVLLLGTTGIALAQDAQIHGAVGLTYQSSYIWRGFDFFAENHSAIEPFIDLKCPNSGFGLTVVGHRAINPDFGNGERWDYNPYYVGSMFADEAYAVNYRIGYVYYNYPDYPDQWYDLQELHTILSFPKLLNVKGLVPSYVLVKLWPSNHDSLAGARGADSASGFAHIFMLDYPLAIKGFMPETPEQILHLHAEAVYNDGVSPNGANPVDHDWSNGVLGVTTDFDLGNSVTLTPGLYYQSSWDDSVNDEDETWATLSLSYKF